MNFDFITARIICGAIPEASSDAVLLQTLGVTCVINCVEEPANKCSKWNGEQCFLPQLDDGNPRDTELVKKGIDYFKSSTGKVYIHCWEERRRAPAMVYAILRSLGMSKESAYSLLIEKRPSCRLLENDQYLQCSV